MSVRFIHITGKCPHCDLTKHQIDTDRAHAVQVLNEAFARHIADEHPEAGPR